MSDSSSESQHCCIVCEKKSDSLLKIAKIEDSTVITSLQKKFNKNVQPSDFICPLCVGSIKSKKGKFQQCDNDERQMKSSTLQGTSQSPKNSGETSSPWNTIIVNNKVPITIMSEKSIPPFPQDGGIKDTYLYERVNQFGPNAQKLEREAQLTFTNELDAWKVLEACQSKLSKYDNEVFMITVDWDDFSAIENLPKNRLLEIFLRFPLAFSDKLIVEMVFQGWKAIGHISWASVTRVGEYWPSATLIDIAIRAGPFLRDVKITLPAVLSNNPAADFKGVEKSLVSVVGNCANLDRLMILLDIPRLPAIMSLAFRKPYMGLLKAIMCSNGCLKRLSLGWVESDPCFIALLPADIEEIHLSGYVPSQSLDFGPLKLSKFRNLQALTLFLFHIGENQLKGIEELENLKVLNLYKSSVHPNNIRNIVNLTKLEYLAIPDCRISDVTLSRILQNNKTLKELDISGNTEITNQSIQYVCTLEYLEVLRMQGLHQVTDVDFTGMTALRTLDCTGCSAITDESIQRLFVTSSVISELFVAGCSVTMECIKTAMKWTSETAKPLVIFVDKNLYDQWEGSARKQFELYSQKGSDKSNIISPGFYVAKYKIPDELWPSHNDWDDYHLANDDHKWCRINCKRIP